jgi:DNA-binding MarR family transcriptional regulator
MIMPVSRAKPLPAAEPRRAARAPRRAPAAREAIDLGRLQNFIGYAVRIAQLAVFEDFNAALAGNAISAAQFSVLCLAADNPGIKQTALAEALRAEPPRMVLIIDDLERRGWLARLPSTLDRRARAIYLTAKGRKQLKLFERRVGRHERRMIERLRGEDKQALLRMLRHLASP